LDLQSILLVAPVLLFSVIAHEYAHGYAALKQGDTTALSLGRLTLNPLKHIDPFLTIILPIVLVMTGGPALGGAKPVPVNPRNYRHFKRGDIIVSLAGVFTNFLLAVACTVLIAVIGAIAKVVGSGDGTINASLGILQAMMMIGIQINLSLIAFNLIPIPPLDGSHVMKYLLPPAWAVRYAQMGFAGLIILLLIMNFVPGFLHWWFTPAGYVQRLLLATVEAMIMPTNRAWM
jgi:Zn-dependent protease